MQGNKIMKNASWIIACRVAQSLLSLGVAMLTARYLGPAHYGVLNYASSLTSFAAPLMALGLNQTLVRELIAEPEAEGEIMGTAMLTSAAAALLCMAGVAGFTRIANPGETETTAVCALYSLLLLFQAMDLIRYWFQKNYRSKYCSVAMLAAYAAASGYRLWLLATGRGILWFAAAGPMEYLLIAAALVALYARLGGRRLRFSLLRAKKLLGASHPYILAGVMVTVFTQTDKIMLKLMLGDEANGCYSAAAACASLGSFVFAALIDSMRPAVLESRRAGQKEFERALAGLYSVVIYLSLLVCLGTTALAGPMVRIVYGEAYLSAVGPLRLVVWHTTFAYLGAVRNVWILAQQQQKYLWRVNLCGALGNVALNALLIPRLGVEGAALASLITQFFTNVVMGWILPPLRENNRILLQGLSPRLLADTVAQLAGRGGMQEEKRTEKQRT